MKKISVILTTILLLSSAVQADWRWNKDRESSYDGGKNPSYARETVTAPSYCYDSGFDFSLFGSGFWPENVSNNGIGGGIGLAYFFNRNFGFEVSYAAHGSGVSQQVGMGNFVYRVPIESKSGFAFAPYIHGGPGLLSQGATEFSWDVGGGVDVRFASWGCVGAFADYTYGFTDDNLQDFSMVRMGMRFPF